LKKYIFILFVFISNQNFGQVLDSLIVESKMWSRDSNRNIQYSDWKKFPSKTVSSLNNFHTSSSTKLDVYGGDKNQSNFTKTGYFRTEKLNNRWWIVDPMGNAFVATAINSVRTGKSENNIKAFDATFSSTEKWIKDAQKMFEENGFNSTGSWSEVAAILNYNKTAKKPIVYCTQLSLLGQYKKQAIQKNTSRKKESDLSFIVDDAFKSFCDKELEKLSNSKNDPNLLGHFSDNEIPFTHTEFMVLLKEKNNFLLNWLKDKNIKEDKITTDNKKEFIGLLAQKYYSTVAPLIKKYDPNHLYIGSRLHSNAKNNEYLFKAAEPFVDIVSINYYGNWQVKQNEINDWATWTTKPFFITEFYTKAEDSKMTNISGAGWLVKTQQDRGIHYQNFCLGLLKAKNCVGWHWFKYQDNDPADKTADESNNDSNKGVVNTQYIPYDELLKWMRELNINKYELIKYFDK